MVGSRRIGLVMVVSALLVLPSDLVLAHTCREQESSTAPQRRALQVIGLPPVGVRLVEGIPSNLAAGVFRDQLESIWQGSETFRRQCDRLAASRVFATIRQDRPAAVEPRAYTTFSTADGAELRAEIHVLRFEQLAELVAHELEHVIERLDGIDLKDHVAAGGAYRNGSGFESHRAIEVGLRVAKELATAKSVRLGL